MQNHIVCICLALCTQYAFAQLLTDAKRDYNWISGYILPPDTISPIYLNYLQGYRLDFITDPVNVIASFNRLDILYNIAIVSDEKGKLLFYTNGCKVADGKDSILANSNINEGSLGYLSSCIGNGGNFINQGTIALPKTSRKDEYYVLHLSYNLINSVIGFQADSLRLSKVVFDSTEQTLSLPFSDQVLIRGDSLFAGQLVACRHGNGNDWWVVQPQSGRNGYYRLLVNTDTIQVVGLQNIGLPNHWQENGWGQACFSPDGTKYARYNGITDLQVFDFDRCTGLLSNPLHVGITDFLDTSYALGGVPGSGVAISPNSRYLYVSSITKVYQFDLQAPDLAASQQTVAVYDGSYVDEGYWFTFNYMQLGPDGKIYMNAPGAIETIHVIGQPDSAGLACQVVQHKYILDYPISRGWPYFPNFRLGPLPGGSCGSIATAEAGRPAAALRVFPSPASQQVTVDVTLAAYDRPDRQVVVVNMLGQVVRRQPLPLYASLLRVAVDDLPVGVYAVCLVEDGQLLAVKEFNVQH